MRRRLTKLAGVIAALAAFAVGGSTLASASQKSSPQLPVATVATQQGDQTGTDAQAGQESQGAETDNVQQGDQSAPDAQPAEQNGGNESSAQSDGPGGYADTNPNADTQQQGEN